MLEVALVPLAPLEGSSVCSIMKLHFVYCLARGVPLNGWTRQHRPVPSSVRRTRCRDADNGGVSPAQLKLYNLLRFPSLPLLPDPVCYAPTDTSYSTFCKAKYTIRSIVCKASCHPVIPVIQAFKSMGHSDDHFQCCNKPTNRRTNNIWGYRFASQTMLRLYWVVQCAGTVSIMQPLLSIMTNGRGN